MELDASQWKERLDFYNAILPAIGAPDWHGTNGNALIDSMVHGDINSIDPPYRVFIRSTANLPLDLAEELRWIKEELEKARAEVRSRYGHDVEVSIEIIS